MSNIIQFKSFKMSRRIDVRSVLANLANNSGGELAEKLTRLVEAMDKRNHEITKLECK